MTKSEIIKQLDDFVSTRAMGCYAYEEATLPNPNPPTAIYGVGGSYEYPIQQSRQEIYSFIDVLLQMSPRNVILETGAGEWVGSHFLWKMLFDKVITIEHTQSIIDKISYPTNPKQDFFIVKDSRQALKDVEAITDKVDVLFLDSIHAKDQIWEEYKIYKHLVREGGLIVFHDALSPLFPDVQIFLNKLRNALVSGGEHEILVIDDSLKDRIGIAYTSSGALPVPSTKNWRMIMSLEDKINEIKGDDKEEYADYTTRVRLTNEISSSVNDLIKNPYGDIDTLRNEGMVSLGSLLSRDQVDDIHEYIFEKKVYNSHIPHGDGNARFLHESPGLLHCYDLKDVIACPHLLEVALSDKVLSLASNYLGCLPTLYSMNLWWSNPPGNPQNIQSFHRDLDDFKFLALFIYLVDVNDQTGPHIYVKFTHDQKIFDSRNKPAPSLFPPSPFPYPPFDYGNDVTTLTGPAGTSYLLDTFGIHKGSSNLRKPRLVVWFRYGLHKCPPVAYQISEPYSLDSLDLVKNKNIEWNETKKYVARVLLK